MVRSIQLFYVISPNRWLTHIVKLLERQGEPTDIIRNQKVHTEKEREMYR